MNYYKRHLGDYAKDTKHLTTYQHGVYAVLLDWYYASEKPIPLTLAYKIVQARSGPERRACDEVLETCFDLSKSIGFAHSKRADIDIAKYRVKQEANSLIAIERESTKRAQNVVETCSKREPSHKPIATSHKKDKAPVVPKGDESAAVVSAYHHALPKCQRMEVMTAKRKRRIANATKLAKQIASEQGWDWDPAEFWSAYFAECSSDPWMRGEVPNPKSATWKQNLDVLLAEDRFATVMDRAISGMRNEHE